MLSLEEIALGQVTFNVLSTSEYKWHETKDVASQRVKCMLLPTQLKLKLRDATNALISQIDDWIFRLRYYIHLSDLVPLVPQLLKIQPSGTLDHFETARNIVHNSVVSRRSRFIVACMYTMEEEIKQLWKELKSEDKKFSWEEEENVPLEYWTHFLEGRLDLLPRSLQQMPEEYALKKSPWVLKTTKHFYKKLPADVRKKNVLIIARDSLCNYYKGDFLVFAMQEMTKEQRNEFCSDWIFKILEVFSEFPHFQNFIAVCGDENIMSWMKNHEFKEWATCFNRIMYISTYYHYKREHLLIMLWLESPTEFREKLCTSGKEIFEILDVLCRKSYFEVARLIFSEVSVEELRLNVICYLFKLYVNQKEQITIADFRYLFPLSYDGALQLKNMTHSMKSLSFQMYIDGQLETLGPSN